MPRATTETPAKLREDKFPPVNKSHIINCSYDQWFPKYRTSCIKTKIIPLTPIVIAYIKEDGILLADDDDSNAPSEDADEWHTTGVSPNFLQEVYSEDSEDENSDKVETLLPPNKRFPEQHNAIITAIKELGGAVVPKLNWSAPKDAAWISSHQNTMKCTTPNDIYILLKSSSFVSHDLENAFDATVNDTQDTILEKSFQPVLILRPFFNPHPALEFRCFVKQRTLVGICQRDLNYYEFLEKLRDDIVDRIDDFFEGKLRMTFPDDSFAFDVYIPEDHSSPDNTGLGRVRLIDINPWALMTDSILFDWSELLNFIVPHPLIGASPALKSEEKFVRLQLDGSKKIVDILTNRNDLDDGYVDPEVRLVKKDDPSAYNFSSSQYSAHKLPKEVVDASFGGQGGLQEFARQWKEVTAGRGGDMFSPAPGQ